MWESETLCLHTDQEARELGLCQGHALWQHFHKINQDPLGHPAIPSQGVPLVTEDFTPFPALKGAYHHRGIIPPTHLPPKPQQLHRPPREELQWISMLLMQTCHQAPEARARPRFESPFHRQAALASRGFLDHFETEFCPCMPEPVLLTLWSPLKP